MSNSFFQFKQFRIDQGETAMKVTTDSCIFGAWVASFYKENNLSGQVLDIGTGTGLLSLMLAQVMQRPICAIEINEAAFRQALENVAASPWPGQIQVQHSSLQNFTTDQAFDLIICNPPFHEKSLKGPDAARNMAHHGESLPLAYLLQRIGALLPSQGKAFLLLPAYREKELITLTSQHQLQVTICIRLLPHSDLPPTRIMICLTPSSSGEKHAVEEEWRIKVADNKYSDNLKRLLDPYYL